MKHFINIFVLLVLIAFVVGTTFLQLTYGGAWFIAYIPLMLILITWLVKLSQDY